MKFEGIEIYGFKSFADRVTIDFQNGLTGIVGLEPTTLRLTAECSTIELYTNNKRNR